MNKKIGFLLFPSLIALSTAMPPAYSSTAQTKSTIANKIKTQTRTFTPQVLSPQILKGTTSGPFGQIPKTYPPIDRGANITETKDSDQISATSLMSGQNPPGQCPPNNGTGSSLLTQYAINQYWFTVQIEADAVIVPGLQIRNYGLEMSFLRPVNSNSPVIDRYFMVVGETFPTNVDVKNLRAVGTFQYNGQIWVVAERF